MDIILIQMGLVFNNLALFYKIKVEKECSNSENSQLDLIRGEEDLESAQAMYEHALKVKMLGALFNPNILILTICLSLPFLCYLISDSHITPR